MNTTIIIHEEDLAKLGGEKFTDTEIKVVSDLSSPTEIAYVPGQKYLVMEKKAYDYITKVQNVHLGPRNEHIGDIVKMPYLVLNNGAILKFAYIRGEKKSEFVSEKVYNHLTENNNQRLKSEILNAVAKSGVSKKTGRPWYRIDYEKLNLKYNDVDKFLYNPNYINTNPPKLRYAKVIRTKEDIDRSFNYFATLKDYIFGLDYETSGIPINEPNVKIMGVGIAAETGDAAYYDMEFIEGTDYYDYFLERYKEFLDSAEDRIYTYNVGFECRATYTLFKKYYNFHDSAVLNILDGNNLKRYSLKYTAMKALGVASWDDDFDYLLEKLPKIFEGNEETKNEIYTRYGEKEEFERLMKKSNNNPFASIPSSILGKYCMLDSFYTVMLKKKANLSYSDTAWNTFCDNLRLGALLDFDGYLKDTEVWEDYVDRLESISAIMNLNLASFYLKKMSGSEEGDDGDLPITVYSLINRRINPHSSKEILKSCQDESWESGYNEDMLCNYGEDLYLLIKEQLELHKISRIEDGTFRKRKLFDDIDRKLKLTYYLPNSIDYYLNLGVARNLENLLMNCSLKEYNQKKRLGRDKEWTNEEIVDFCSDIVNVASPIESMKFLATLYYEYEKYIIDKLPECDLSKFNTPDLQIVSEDLEKAGFKKEEDWNRIYHIIMCRGLVKEKEHPELHKRMEFIIEPVLYQLKERKESKLAAFLQGGAYNELSKEEQANFIEFFDDIDVRRNSVQSLVKLSTAYRMFKKSEKRLKTYLKKILLKEDKQTNGYDENLFTTETFGGPVTKSYQRYEICCKKSKRWSAAIHTLSPKDEAKRVITTPEGYLMSYFDIN